MLPAGDAPPSASTPRKHRGAAEVGVRGEMDWTPSSFHCQIGTGRGW